VHTLLGLFGYLRRMRCSTIELATSHSVRTAAGGIVHLPIISSWDGSAGAGGSREAGCVVARAWSLCLIPTCGLGLFQLAPELRIALSKRGEDFEEGVMHLLRGIWTGRS
jgi:hypothetical protein